MDADRLLNLVKALDGDQTKPKQFFMTSGDLPPENSAICN
jgi:hypothetical protein